MKIVWALGFAALLGVGYYFADQYRDAHSADAEHAAWKKAAVEPETAVRPDSYAAMMWSPSDVQPEAEVRSPASVPKKAGKSKKK